MQWVTRKPFTSLHLPKQLKIKKPLIGVHDEAMLKKFRSSGIGTPLPHLVAHDAEISAPFALWVPASAVHAIPKGFQADAQRGCLFLI